MLAAGCQAEMIDKISGLEEVSFYMLGADVVRQATRLGSFA
jgi:hypothetical protein